MSSASHGSADPVTSPVSTVRTDLTDTHFRGYVRHEEYWPEDSPEYQAGNDIHNRKRPPPEEVPGDAFDRQRVMYGFDQGLIERQVCLVLGTGGIGMDVALTLARLGVERIILVDRDVYDASNLTRQCLGSKASVGMRKVDAAAQSLREQHSIRTEIETIHCDAVLEWPKIVEAARRATVVFNGIDVGVMWDFCVNSLCKELGLPLVSGQSFAWKYMSEFYTGGDGEVCAFCYETTETTFAATDSLMRRKGGVLERLEAFVEERRRNNLDVILDADTLEVFFSQDKQFRYSGGAFCNVVIAAALSRTGLRALSPGDGLATSLLRFLKSLREEVTTRLMPGHISKLSDVAFIPRPAHADTRFIGSWICPCMGCAVLMVSQWTAYLTMNLPEAVDGASSGSADQRTRPLRNLPQTITFNLDMGMTSEEQMGYELGAIGCPPDKAERRFCRDASSAECTTCRYARLCRVEESLFIGRIPVVLAQVAGDTIPLPETWELPPPGPERQVATEKALKRREPLTELGEEYTNAVIPALPSLDWEPSAANDPSADWPPALSQLPLLKVPWTSLAERSPSALYGVASGVRSALVRERGKWWRLKGCGNRDQGFPVEAKGDHGELTVRGACFQHTANTELKMSAVAMDVLAKAGLDCANRPAGSYCYAADPKWPLPQIERYCAVFETLGNARLGDHLLAGLMVLLPFVVPMPNDGFAALRSAIVTGRNSEPNELWTTEMTVSCDMRCADVALQLSIAGDSLFESAQGLEAAELLALVPAQLRDVWKAARDELDSSLQVARAAAGESSLILWLCWRLGWECGAIVKALHDAGIAWGTYPDAMGIHCNAHVNNLVVKPPGVGRTNRFLAALDFDMAFTQESFLAEAAASHSGMGLDSWEGVLNFEATMGMKTVLAGSSFASTGVANASPVPPSHAKVEMAVRDTLVAAYDSAREGGVDSHPAHAMMEEAARELIKLALCLTTHVEG